MDFSSSLNAKGLFRFTGPPENWLTAIKYMMWGLEEKYKDRWKEIQPGDIFFIHSTGKSLFSNAKSGIIGLGVVGENFSIKDNYLWIHEFKDKVNRWPLLVPFSEIYLFSDIPFPETWEAPNLSNESETKHLIDLLLKNYTPISHVTGFPQMGSFSSVSKEVAKQILFDKRPLHVFTNNNNSYISSVIDEKPRRLLRMSDASEALRYTTSLKDFKTIETRIVNEGKGFYTKDNALLAKAERVHSNIVQKLYNLFTEKGYDVLESRTVDLFAYNKEKSFLFEVKSTENKNFRKQAQKGIIQLFEYNYFDIAKFVNENNLSLKEKHNVLAVSQEPRDEKYVEFINYLKVGVATVDNDTLKPVGTDLGFTKI